MHVDYVHYTEGTHQAALGTAASHTAEPPTGHQHPQ